MKVFESSPVKPLAMMATWVPFLPGVEETHLQLLMSSPHQEAEELHALVFIKQSDAFPGRAMGILGIEN